MMIKFKSTTLAATFLLKRKDHKAGDPGAKVLSAKWLWQWNNGLFLKNAVKPSQFGELSLCKNYTSTHVPSPDQFKT